MLVPSVSPLDGYEIGWFVGLGLENTVAHERNRKRRRCHECDEEDRMSHQRHNPALLVMRITTSVCFMRSVHFSLNLLYFSVVKPLWIAPSHL